VLKPTNIGHKICPGVGYTEDFLPFLSASEISTILLTRKSADLPGSGSRENHFSRSKWSFSKKTEKIDMTQGGTQFFFIEIATLETGDMAQKVLF
jgi:hypothetical protein